MTPLQMLKAIKHRFVRQTRANDGGYIYRRGDSVVEDYAEFTGMPIDEISRRITAYHQLNAAEWNNLDGENFADKAAHFYEDSENFIFDTLSANTRPQVVIDKLNRFNRSILDGIRSHPGRQLFEFGGGIGVFSEIAARMGKEVHYMELPGIVFDFALWRFQKYGLAVTPHAAKSGEIRIPGRFDIVYTDAVIEHLPPVLQVETTHVIAQAVGDGGMLVFLVDLSGPTPEDPMHHHVDIAGLHALLKTAGLSCADGLNTFCSIWRRA